MQLILLKSRAIKSISKKELTIIIIILKNSDLI